MEINGIVLRTSKTKKSKSLPKRTGKRAARNAARWAAQKVRKQMRQLAQEEAHARNVARGYTGRDLARAARKARRNP